MNYTVRVTQKAERDLNQAFRWWAENRSSAEASRWYQAIGPAINSLTINPQRCGVAEETDLLDSGIWQLLFGTGRKPTHRVLFTIQEQTVVVLRIRHIAQQSLASDGLQ